MEHEKVLCVLGFEFDKISLEITGQASDDDSAGASASASADVDRDSPLVVARRERDRHLLVDGLWRFLALRSEWRERALSRMPEYRIYPMIGPYSVSLSPSETPLASDVLRTQLSALPPSETYRMLLASLGPDRLDDLRRRADPKPRRCLNGWRIKAKDRSKWGNSGSPRSLPRT
jgi:hypothetical protein